MIIGTEVYKPREIGARYTGLWMDGVYHDQPFVVLREATSQEWTAERLAEGRAAEMPCDPSQALFYEVSTD
jgi:hypothetical protein